MDLIFAPFVRKPFTVEAVQVTEENMKEIAKLIGRVQTEPNGNRFIQVHKGKVPNVTKVYVDYWVTRLSDKNTNLRVYSAKTFAREFESNLKEAQADNNSIQSDSTVHLVANEDASEEVTYPPEPQVSNG